MAELLEKAGHAIARRDLLPDEPDQVRRWVEDRSREEIDLLLLNGGTGISRRDRTHEAVRALLERELPGFGELFRWLSYREIGSAAMASRALAGLVNGRVVFSMPGSPAAVRLAMEELILPEGPHLVAESRR
jgi:molybdenum cofactor biosynthesis protein B